LLEYYSFAAKIVFYLVIFRLFCCLYRNSVHFQGPSRDGRSTFSAVGHLLLNNSTEWNFNLRGAISHDIRALLNDEDISAYIRGDLTPQHVLVWTPKDSIAEASNSTPVVKVKLEVAALEIPAVKHFTMFGIEFLPQAEARASSLPSPDVIVDFILATCDYLVQKPLLPPRYILETSAILPTDMETKDFQPVAKSILPSHTESEDSLEELLMPPENQKHIMKQHGTDTTLPMQMEEPPELPPHAAKAEHGSNAIVPKLTEAKKNLQEAPVPHQVADVKHGSTGILPMLSETEDFHCQSRANSVDGQ
jgi:hypothetical protein